jgi:hypothetical protein
MPLLCDASCIYQLLSGFFRVISKNKKRKNTKLVNCSESSDLFSTFAMLPPANRLHSWSGAQLAAQLAARLAGCTAG